MIYDSIKVKVTARELGADLCGITSPDSFHDAPAGHKPTDIYQKCKSVIVFAKRMPEESMFAVNCVPYTHIENIIAQEVDRIGFKLCIALEEMGIGAIPIPSEAPYEYWESENSYGRAILSMRHAAYHAGLGILGKNTLLINKKLGNIIQIGAVLADIALESDPVANYEVCPEHCSLCIDSCPVKALDGSTVNQELCRQLSSFKTEKGHVLQKCNQCRKVCPNHSGLIHKTPPQWSVVAGV